MHERLTWEIVTLAEKTNVNRGKAEVDIGFQGVTVFFVIHLHFFSYIKAIQLIHNI